MTVYLPEVAEFRAPDYDLTAALDYNPQGFVPNDIKHIHATVAGANDEADWYWVVEFKTLQEGCSFALIDAWCDYTGWDCQSGATTSFAHSPESAADFAPEQETYGGRRIRSALQDQIDGKELYGVYTYPAPVD